MLVCLALALLLWGPGRLWRRGSVFALWGLIYTGSPYRGCAGLDRKNPLCHAVHIPLDPFVLLVRYQHLRTLCVALLLGLQGLLVPATPATPGASWWVSPAEEHPGTEGSAVPLLGLEQFSPLPGLPGDEAASGVLPGVWSRLQQEGTRLFEPQQLAGLLGRVQQGGTQQALLLRAESLADMLLAQGMDELERRAQGRWLRNLELRYRPGYGSREELFDVDLLVSLLDLQDRALFSQAGGQLRGGKAGFHTGLGYRHMLGRDVLFGVNAFYDYLSAPVVSRWSVGGEFKNRWIDLYGNWYRGLRDGVALYSPDGWDAGVVGRVPGLPWLEFTGQYYTWERVGDKALSGQDYALVLTPVPLLAMEFHYDNPQSGESAWGVELSTQYRFGMSLREQLRPTRHHEHMARYRRFERVRREYEQRVQSREVAPSGISRVSISSAGVGSVDVRQAPAPSLLRSSAPVNVTLTLMPSSGSRTALGLAAAEDIQLGFEGSAVYGQDYLITRLMYRIGVAEPVAVTAGREFRVPIDASRVFFALEVSGTASPDCTRDSCTVSIRVDTSPPLTLAHIQPPGTSNNAPQPVGTLPSVSVVSSGIQTVEVSNAFRDTDSGDRLSYSALSSAPEVASVAVAGSMVTLTALSVGNSEVTVTATDRAGATAVQRFRVTVTAAGTPGVTVSRANLSVAEGGTGTYTVVLNAAPTANVVITPASDNGDVTFSPSTLTFATGTWNIAQDVMVSAAEDDDAVNDQAALSHTAASTDSNYAGISIASVDVTVTDNDVAPGTVFTATVQAAISVGEDAGPALVPVTVSGNVAPQGDVTVPYSITAGTATGAGVDYTVPSPASLVFTVSEFSGGTATKNISIPIMDDTTDESDETFTVTLEVPTGAAADRFMVGSLSSGTVTITDNDAPPNSAPQPVGTLPSVSVVSSGMQTVEVSNAFRDTDTGDRLSYSAVSSIPGVASVAVTGSMVTLTALSVGNSDVTVTATDRAGATAVQRFRVTVTAAGTPGVTVNRANLSVTEGGTGTYTVVLNAAPTANVVITPASDNGDVTFSPSTLTFATDTWSIAQDVTVSAAEDDDAVNDGAALSHTAASTDSNYSGIGIASVAVTVMDNDVVTATVQAAVSVGEDAGPALVPVTVSGNVAPQGDVTVPYSITAGTATGAGADYTVPSPASLVFTVSEFSGGMATKNISIPIMDDTTAEPDETFTVTLEVPTGDAAENFAVGSPSSSTVTITDNDEPPNNAPQPVGTLPSVSVMPAGTQTVEVSNAFQDTDTGDRLSYSALSSAPGVVGVAVTGSMVTLTALSVGNSEVTVTATDRAGATAVQSFMVTVTAAGTPGVTVNRANLSVAEGGTGTYTVVLNAAPTANVVITPASDNGDVTFSPSTLTFATGTWSIAQGVTVSAAEDDDAVNDQAALSHTAASTDSNYSGIGIASVAVTVMDNDVVTATVQAAVSVGEEAGPALVPVTVSGNVAPQGDVTVPYSITAGTATGAGVDYTVPSPASLVFTVSEFSGGMATKNISIPIMDDTTAESDETFTVTLEVPTGDAAENFAVGSPSSSTVTITDNDEPPNNAPQLVGTLPSVSVVSAGTQTVEVSNAFQDTDTGDRLSYSAVSSAPEVASVAVTGSMVTLTALSVGNSEVTVTATDRAGATAVQSFMVTVTEAPGVTVSEVNLSVTEGGTGTYTVVLDVAPTANVVITPASDNGDVTFSPSTLTFATGTWNIAQDVVVSAAEDDDAVNDGAALSHTAASTDSNYAGISIASVAVTVMDNDVVTATVQAAVSVGEDAGPALVPVTVSGNVAPQGDVTVPYSITAGTATGAGVDYTVPSPASLVFTVAEFSGGTATKNISIPIMDDTTDEPDETFTVTLEVPTGDAAENFAVGSPSSSTVTITDNDEPPNNAPQPVGTLPSVSVASAGMQTVEVSNAFRDVDGDRLSYGALSSAPEVVSVAVMGSVVTLTALSVGNSEVTVTASDHTSATAVQRFTVTVMAPGVTVSEANLSVTEGGTGTYTVVLDAAPTANVVITPASDNSEVTFSPSTLTFTADTWSIAQGVTVSAAEDDDAVNDGAVLSHTAASTDSNYADISIVSVAVTVIDDEVFTATVQAAVSVEEGAGPALVPVTVSGSAAPQGDITVPYSITAGTASRADYTEPRPTSLVFTVADLSSGTATNNISIPIMDDRSAEPDETFTVTLEVPTGVAADRFTVGSSSSSTVTITDNELVFTATVQAAVSVGEAAGPAMVPVTVSGSAAPRGDITVSYSVTPGTATGGGTDYMVPSLTSLVFAVSEFSGTGSATLPVNITLIDDMIYEGDEQFTVTLESVMGAAREDLPGLGGTSSSTVTITDDEVRPATFTLSLNPTSLSESAGATTVTVVVTLPGPASLSTQTEFALSVTGSATAPDDYTQTGSLVVMVPPESLTGSTELTLTPMDDTAVEGDETLQYTVTSNGFAPQSATLTLMDDNTATATDITLSLDRTSGTEGDSPTDYTVTATSGAPAATDIVVTLMLGGTVTATGPSADYMVSGTQSITISMGASTGMTVLTLTLVDDVAVEGTESIVVTGTASSFTIAGSPVITLQDNDAAPSTIILTTNPAEVMEGAGATDVVVTATLGDGSVTLPDAVDIALELGGSASPDDDYTVTGTLLVRIPAGSATGMRTLTFTAQVDAVLETESIELTGARVAGYTVTGATLALQDATVYTATVPSAVSVTEGTAAVVPVTVTGAVAPRGDITVPYSLVLVTARAGFDYTVPSAGALLFTTTALASGSASQDVSIPILDDGEAESAETFRVTLDTPAGAAGDAFRLGDVSSTTVTIMDAGPSGHAYDIALSPATATAEEDSGMLRLLVTVSPSGHAQNPQAAFAVPLQVGGGTAQSGADYTAPGMAAVQFAVADFTNGMATQEIVIRLLADVEVEGEEAFTVGLGNVVGAVDRFTVTQPTTMVIIEDNDLLLPSASFGETISALRLSGFSREITGPRYVAPGELVEYEFNITESGRFVHFIIGIVSGTGTVMAWANEAAGTCASGAVACLVVPSSGASNAVYSMGGGLRSTQRYTSSPGLSTRTIQVRIPTDAGDGLNFVIAHDVRATGHRDGATITVQTPRVAIVDRAMFAESAGTQRLAVSVSSNAQDIDVPFTVVADSATEGTDFHLRSVSPLRFVQGNFRSGVATKDIEIALVDDRIPEAAETFTIMLGTPVSTTISGFVLEQDSAQVTINDDDDMVVITAGFEHVTSLVDEQATGMVAVTLDSLPGSTLSIPLTDTTVVDSAKYTLAGVAGVNITGAHPAWVLEIPVAASVAEFTVTVADDADTVNESLVLTLGGDTMVPPRWRLAPGAGVHTVAFVDDDATQPGVGFAAGSPAVATEGAAGVLLGVVVENPGSSDLSVSVGISGTAVAEDYSLRLARVPAPPAGTLLSGAHDAGYTLTVPAGATALYLRVQAAEDADQMDETLVLTLETGAGYALLAATRTLTLLDADVVPVVGFAQSASTVAEDAGEVVELALSVTGLVQGELSVAWRARLVTGQVDAREYQVGNLALPARAGAVLGGVAQVRATGGEVLIRIRNDQLQELADGEVLELVLQPGEGYTLGAGMTEHRLTIQEGVCDRTLAVSAGLTGLAAATGCVALDSAALAGLDGTLDLSAIGLETLTAMDFAGLSMLRGLNLSDNTLRTLPAGLFEPLDSLVQLDLSGNAGLSVAAGMLDGLLSRTGVSLALPEPSRLSIVGGAGSPTAGGAVQFDMELDRSLPFELELSYTYSGGVQPFPAPGRVVFASGDRMQSVTVRLPRTALVGEVLTLEPTLMVRTTEGVVSPSSADIVATTIVLAVTEATVVPEIPMTEMAFVRASDVVSRNADVVRVPMVIRNLPANSGVELRVLVAPYFRGFLTTDYGVKIGSAASMTLPAETRDVAVVANLRIDNNTEVVMDKVVDVAEIEVQGGLFFGHLDDLLLVQVVPSAEAPPAGMTTVPVSLSSPALYQLTVQPGLIPSLSFDVAELEVEEDDGDAGTAVRTVMVPLRVSDLAPTIRRVTVTFDPVLVTTGTAESDEYQALGVAVPHNNPVVMNLDTDGSSSSRVFMLPVQIRDDTLAEDLLGETLKIGIDSSIEVRFEFASGNDFSVRSSVAPVTLRVLEGICDSRTAAVAAALAVAAGVEDCYRVRHLDTVRNLDLRGLRLGELVAADLAGLQQLQRLQLDQNALSTLAAPAFADLDALSSLTLTRNPSLSLPVGVLDGVLDTLETLAVDAPLRPQVEVRADGGRFVLELTRGLPVELRVPYTLSGMGFSSEMAMATVPAGSRRVGIALPDSASGLADVQLGGLDDWQVWDSESTARGVLSAGSLIQVPVGSAASLTVPAGALPVLTFSSELPTEVTEGAAVMLTATLTPAPTSAEGLTVPMTIVATLGSNYILTATGATLSAVPRMLTFPMGVTTATLTLMAEEDEDIAGAFVQLNLEVDTTSPARWQLGDRPYARVLIADNDVLPEIRFARVNSEVEGDPGTVDVELEAYGLALGATVEVLLTMSLQSGSALADEYTLGGTGTLPAGFAADDPAPTVDFMVTLTGDGSDPYRSNVTVGAAEVIGQEIEHADGDVLRLSLRTDAAYTLQSEPSMASAGYMPCEHARTCHAVRVLEGVCDRTAGVSAGLSAQTGYHCTAVDAAILRDMYGTLDLSERGITGLQAGDFTGLGSLEALDLSGNGLSTLAGDVFDGLEALVVLDLSGNAFTGVPQAALAGVSGLETLDLSGNDLSGALSGQPFATHGMLRRLLLQNNQLTRVAADALTLAGGARMAMLEVLDLSSNALTGLAADSLTGMDSLRELDLSGNSGLIPTAGMLDEVLDTLQYFVMEDLPAYLSAAVGAELPEVRLSAPLPMGLRVAYTLQTGTGAAQPGTVEFAVGETLQTIMPLAGTEPTILRLQPESEWQLLDADSQELSAGTLGVRHFVSLRTVEELRYTPSENPAAVVSICGRSLVVQEALRGSTACDEVTAGQLANVETLDLSNMGLAALATGDLEGLSGLRRLSLSGNGLSDIAAELFAGLPALEELDLSSNSLVDNWSLPGLPRLEVLNLGGMPSLSSIPDGTFRSLPALRTLVLHSSGLRTLPADIGSLASLQTLDLRNMPELSLTTELLDSVLDVVPAPSGDTGLLVDQVVVELRFGVEFRAQRVTALTDVSNDYFHIVLDRPLPSGLHVPYSLTQDGVTSSYTVDVAAGATVQTVPLPGTVTAGSTLVVRLGDLSTWSLLGVTIPALPLSVFPVDALVDVGRSSLSLTVPDDIATRYPLVRLNFIPELTSSIPFDRIATQVQAVCAILGTCGKISMQPPIQVYQKDSAVAGEVSIEVQVLGLGTATTLTVPWQLAVQELDDVAETGEYSVDGMDASRGTFTITGDGSPVVTRTVRLMITDNGTNTGRELVTFYVGESTDNPVAYQLSTTSYRFVLDVLDAE